MLVSPTALTRPDFELRSVLLRSIHSTLSLRLRHFCNVTWIHMLASVTLATFQGFTPASSPRDHASVYINQACLPVTFVSSLISLANTVSSLPSTSRSFARHRVLRFARATHHASAPCIFTILLAPCLDPHVRPCACRLSGSARNHRWVALAHDACVSVRHVLVQSQSYPRRTQLATYHRYHHDQRTHPCTMQACLALLYLRPSLTLSRSLSRPHRLVVQRN